MNAPHFRGMAGRSPGTGSGHLLTLVELTDEHVAEQPSAPTPLAGSDGLWGSTGLLLGLQRGDPAPRPDDPPAGPPERRVGPYYLIDRLGRGSQAEVWKAVQVAPRLQTVALRVLAPELARDPRRREAFLRTARLSRQLPSPPWLPTLAYGDADGVLYQAMPLIEGAALDRAISSRRDRTLLGTSQASDDAWWTTMPDDRYVETIVRLMAQVARAVAVAHGRGVVHRDIKPGNLLLDRSHAGTVYLADLGIGRDLADPDPTPFGNQAGTLMYMAPERLLGLDADERLADVYALGVTMYEALTLAHPWQVPEGMPRSCLPGYVAAHVPPRPRALCPGLSRHLERIVLKAMAGEPRDRYPSAASLARDLDQVVWGRPDAEARSAVRAAYWKNFPSRSHLFLRR